MRSGDRPADSPAAADSVAAHDGGAAAADGGAAAGDGGAPAGEPTVAGTGPPDAVAADGLAVADVATGDLTAADTGPPDAVAAADGLAVADVATGDLAAAGAGPPDAAARGPATAKTRAVRAVKAGRAGLAGTGRRIGRIAAARRMPPAGGVFAQLTVLPAILVMAWFLLGLPLLLAGAFVPAAMLLISVPLAVLLVLNWLRWAPARWPRALPGPGRERAWTSWWGLAGTVAVAAGFAAWQLHANSPSVIVSRDPGAALQAGYWIAQHGSLDIPRSLAAFGGAHPGLSFSSIGFFPHGSSVVPSGMSGLPMLIAGGFWIHGLSAAAAMSPILGAFAVLAFGGLAGRLAGPQWAPAAALVLGFTLPEQYASRSAFSEPVLQLLLIGGLCLLIDSLTLGSTPGGAVLAPRGWPRWITPPGALAALAGLALGLVVLVQADGFLYLLPVIPFAGLLLASRRAEAGPFTVGLAAGIGYGIAGGYLGSRPYLDTIARPLLMVGLAAAVLAAATAAGALLARPARIRRGLRKVAGTRPARWLPAAGGVMCAAALIGLAVRPYVQTVRGHPNPAAAAFVARLQRLQHLPVDPARLYAEDTLYWVIWYVGVPTVLLGGLGLVLLTRRTLRALLTWQDVTRTVRNWGLPLAIICWGMAAVLWRPGTLPDQPWASRRLVPVVLPGLILCAIWASAWLVGRARERGAGRAARSLAGACCVAALLFPTALTTFGAGLAHSGKAGSLRPVADGLALKRTGAGEEGAVRRLCASIGADASVVIIDRPVAQRFTQVIRGMCGVPAGWMSDTSVAAVRGVLNGISAAGRRPVLLARRAAQLAPYGTQPVKVLDLRTTQDSHELNQPPTAPVRLRYVIWLAAPTVPSVGA